MNIRKELIKAGFDDQTHLSGSDEVEFEMYHDLPKGEAGVATIKLQKLKEFDEVKITIYSDSGYELLVGMAEMEVA
jgi:hypothetical protein